MINKILGAVIVIAICLLIIFGIPTMLFHNEDMNEDEVTMLNEGVDSFSFSHKGHDYIAFYWGMSQYNSRGGVVHDPDCRKCIDK